MKLFRYLILLINIGVALFLWASYLCHYFNPQEVWYFELISLGYPTYVFFNLCFVFYWLIGSTKKFALVSGITLLFGLSTFFDSFAFSGKKDITPNENTVTVVSYNVMAFNYGGWRNRSTIQHNVFTYLKEQQPDIICFQEFHYDKEENFRLLDSIRKQLKLPYSHIYKIDEIKNRYFYGNVIYSRYRIIQTGIFMYQKTGNSTIWADIVKNEDTIRIYNNHLESYRLQPDNIETLEETTTGQDFESDKIKGIGRKLVHAVEKRGQQTNELVTSIQECPYKMFVCGDFNSPPYSYVYHAIKNSIDLEDAFTEAGTGIGGTLNWRLPSQRLDYILYSSDFETIEFKKTRLKISDHYPICATINLKE